jgi:hypothetical protein
VRTAQVRCDDDDVIGPFLPGPSTNPVGLSLGHPGGYTSFSTVLTPVSKFVISIVMLLGRHRGLPLSIDHAVNFKTHISLDRHTHSALSNNVSGGISSGDYSVELDTLGSRVADSVASGVNNTRRATLDLADIRPLTRRNRSGFNW